MRRTLPRGPSPPRPCDRYVLSTSVARPPGPASIQFRPPPRWPTGQQGGRKGTDPACRSILKGGRRRTSSHAPGGRRTPAPTEPRRMRFDSARGRAYRSQWTPKPGADHRTRRYARARQGLRNRVARTAPGSRAASPACRPAEPSVCAAPSEARRADGLAHVSQSRSVHRGGGGTGRRRGGHALAATPWSGDAAVPLDQAVGIKCGRCGAGRSR